MTYHPSRTQQHVINEAMRAPSWRRAPLRAKVALLEALGTEAGYTNPAHGDRDSLGALQQRASWGSAASRLDVTQSAERFLQHAIPLAGKFSRSGDLAQAVQRSAFPGRYQTHQGEALALVRGSSGGALPADGSTTTQQTVQLPQLGQVDVASLLGALNQPRPVQVSAPPPPSFAAQGPPAPFGYTPPPAVGGSAGPAQPSIDQLLQIASQPQTVAPGTATSTQTVQNPAPGVSGASRSNGSPLTRKGKIIGVPYQGTHTLGNWQSDNAVDVAVPVGTPVYAATSGAITRAGPLGGQSQSTSNRFAGSRVQIGDAVWYGHLSRLTVKQGQRVKRGQLIGYSGAANGVAHLHFAARSGDPRRYLR